MKKIHREDIQIFSRYTNLTDAEVDGILSEQVYNDKHAWQKFLHLMFISLGLGFVVAGIIFFFAYNWADLHKFIKIALIEGLVVFTTFIALLPRIRLILRKIILTAASVLVGALFAVYGQIYQTGANAYDFFLVWTIFITLWVAVSNFAPLWLLYIILINTTFGFFTDQVVKGWSDITIYTILFFINMTAFCLAFCFFEFKKIIAIPSWFIYVLALMCISCATVGIMFGIHNSYGLAFPILAVSTTLIYGLGIGYGYKTKNGFYLAAIPLSIILIIVALLLKISDGKTMFLIIAIFIISSITLVIKNLIHIQKSRIDEK